MSDWTDPIEAVLAHLNTFTDEAEALQDLKSGVSVIILHNENKQTVFVGSTPENARSQLNKWVQKNWAEYFDREDMPANPDDARQKFFSYHHGEYPYADYYANVPINFGEEFINNGSRGTL